MVGQSGPRTNFWIEGNEIFYKNIFFFLDE